MQKIDAGLLILRVVFGVTMFCHGWNKVFSPSGLRGTSSWFSSLGMKWPRVQATVAASSELIAGALMVVGLLTGVSATIFISLMIVAIVTVHGRVGFFIFLPKGGWEYCAAIIAVATTLSLTGPGKYSLDEWWGWTTGHSAWALPLGVGLAVCHVAITYRPSHSNSQP